jgi:hypothetical protein
MLHPADDLLADIAALLEVDALEHVHADVMGEGVIGGKVVTLVQHAGGDAHGVIGGIVGRPAGGGRHRGHDPPAQLHRAEPVAVGDAFTGGLGGKADAMAVPQVLDLDPGAQAVHAHALEEIVGRRLVDVEPQRLVVPAGQALGQDLALRRQQGPPGGGAVVGGRDMAGHHIVEQLVGIGAGKAERDTVGAQMDGHGPLLPRRGVRYVG